MTEQTDKMTEIKNTIKEKIEQIGYQYGLAGLVDFDDELIKWYTSYRKTDQHGIDVPVRVKKPITSEKVEPNELATTIIEGLEREDVVKGIKPENLNEEKTEDVPSENETEETASKLI